MLRILRIIKMSLFLSSTMFIFSSLLNAENQSNSNAKMDVKVIAALTLSVDPAEASLFNEVVQNTNVNLSANPIGIIWTMHGEPNHSVNITYQWKNTENAGDGTGVTLTVASKLRPNKNSSVGELPLAGLSGSHLATLDPIGFNDGHGHSLAGNYYVILAITNVSVAGNASLGLHVFTQSVTVSYNF